VKAVIFDWAGTTVDFGSFEPVRAFVEIFKQSGVGITVAEAREPMGLGKFDHIASIMRMERVAREWQRVHQGPATTADVQRLYENFLPVQKAVLAQHSDIIPGTVETVAWLRERGIGIGSTTGYTRELMAVLAPLAGREGFAPDNVVCIDDVPAGRPAPWMLLKSAEQLGAYPIPAIVAVDDTTVGLEAARNAGAIAVGVALTGNALGLSREELAALSPDALSSGKQAAYQALQAASPDFIIDGVGDLPATFERIEALIAARTSQQVQTA
jgi:phosphonoacetaldehyde hydrolase